MASALRTKAPIRAVQSFSATSVKVPAAGVTARNLHMTGAREASPALTSFETSMADVPRRKDIINGNRKFNTTRTLKAVGDSSTVDFAYLPEISFANPASAEIQQIPILPDNYTPRRTPHHITPADFAAEPPVRMPEISTTSLSNAVSAFTEIDASKAADMIGLVETKAKEEGGMVKRVMTDMLDDLLGAGKRAQAA